MKREIGKYYRGNVCDWYVYDKNVDIEKWECVDKIIINCVFGNVTSYYDVVVQEIFGDDVPVVLREYVESPFLDIDVERYRQGWKG
jgi:hypothetical protein